MRITIEYDPDTDQYVSLSDDPPVASQGNTPGEALEAVLEAIDLWRATVAAEQAKGAV